MPSFDLTTAATIAELIIALATIAGAIAWAAVTLHELRQLVAIARSLAASFPAHVAASQAVDVEHDRRLAEHDAKLAEHSVLLDAHERRLAGLRAIEPKSAEVA